MSYSFRRIVKVFRFLGFGNGPKVFEHISRANESIGKLLVIGPGILEIPPKGWGAIETIIFESIPTFVEAGFEVSLLNTEAEKLWRKARKSNFDIILSYFDPNAQRVVKNFPKTPKVAVCQYGYINVQPKWHRSFHKCFKYMKKFDAVVVMNKATKDTLRLLAPTTNIIISSNGSNFNPEISKGLKGPFLSLGKVEPRKSQFELFKRFEQAKIPINFIGRIEDERVSKLLDQNDQLSNVFIGEKTRIELEREFKNYCALVLLSFGEADALVLYEAQLAGLPIFVTREGLGAQNPELPWVNIIDFNVDPNAINELVYNLSVNPEEISTYAKKNYRWQSKNIPLISELKKFVE